MTVYAPSFLPYLRDLNVITPSHVYIRSIYKYTCLKCKKKLNEFYIYIYIYNLCIPSVYPLKACHLLNDASRYAKSHMNLRIPWHAGHGRAAKGQVRGSPLACATNTWEVDFFWSTTTLDRWVVWVPGICGATRFFEESYRRYKHIQVVPLYILFTQKRFIAFKHMQISEMPDSDSTKRIATDRLLLLPRFFGVVGMEAAALVSPPTYATKRKPRYQPRACPLLPVTCTHRQIQSSTP